MGLLLLWRTTRLINLAQAAMGLIGGVATALLVAEAHWSFWWAAPFGLVVGALLAYGTDRIVLRKMGDAPRAAMLVVTIGLGVVFSAIQFGLPLAFVGRQLSTPHYDIGLSFHVGTFLITGEEVLALILFPIAVAAVVFFVYRTRFGLAALALGQDVERARSLGVSAST
ncbi:MAG: hypothetical protein ABR552_00210, partial [Actinomycetota bacterium]